MKKQYIYTLFAAFSMLGTPVFADVITEIDSADPYFASTFNINQGDGSFAVTVVPLYEAKGTPAGFVPDSRYEDLKAYDRRLPYVNYAVRKPQEFKKYLDRQISQEAQKLGVKDFDKITLDTVILIALRVTNAHLTYEKRMVAVNPEYSRALDDAVSSLPLDVMMKQKRGVCRQYAAVFEVVFERIVATSRSTSIRYAIVDEVLSQDLNHTYNVVYVPQVSLHSALSLQAVFVEPIKQGNQLTLKTADALDNTHDGIFSELVAAGRWSVESDAKETLLTELAQDNRYGSIVQKQAQTELLAFYNDSILDQISGTGYENMKNTAERAASLVANISSDASTVKTLDDRYNHAKSIYAQIQRLAMVKVVN
ncbi:hypothetical protein HY620_03535 [Candidatus Uhrbacteria bacterium]|nr:hypothetical protein [Candidatus Uhrbacteria bacterium]